MSARSGGVLIMAGGTGGHIYPGLAVARALLEDGIDVHWLGARCGMECSKVPVHGIEVDAVRVRGLRGKGLAGWIALPFRLARGIADALRVIGRRRPACAVSFGGYVAGPGGLAARLRGVPLVVHEQNRIPGLTNRVLARFASQILQAFSGTFPDRLGALTVGNPVREEVEGLPSPEQRWSDRDGPARLLVTGGSQGARALNQAVPLAVSRLSGAARPQVRHQAGEKDAADTRLRYAQTGVEAEVVSYIEDMATAYAWADLVVCRAGALTVSELAAAGVGAILVPFPHAVDDHQTANAAFLAECGAAMLLPESELAPESLADALQGLLANRERTLEMARRARSASVADAAGAVAKVCHRWVRA